MDEQQPKIEVHQDGDVIEIVLLDKDILDEVTINQISESLFGVIQDKSPVKMVLNFENVKHLSSSALGVLIRLNKHIKEEEGEFCLCNIKPSLYEIFVITKLNKVFKIYDNTKAAIKSL